MLLQPVKERISDRLINDSELSCSQVSDVVDLVFEELLDFRYGHIDAVSVATGIEAQVIVALLEEFLNE